MSHSNRSHVFTAIVDTYYRPVMLRQAVEALLRQTYPYLEIILVNNGATPETVEYLKHVSTMDERVKLIHFTENQYDPEDPLKMLDTCLNAALQIATGDYVWYQSDDDWIGDDYAEKMVRLFCENPECTTAAGLPVGVDVNGVILDQGPRSNNFRPRYVSGVDLVLDHLEGGTMFSAPGTIFTIRRDALVAAGGFHRCLEYSQLLGIVPFGVTGFDETAILYWRRHDGQLNKQLTSSGHVGIKESLSLLKDWELAKRWHVFGHEIAHKVVNHLEQQVVNSAAVWFVINYVHGRYSSGWRIARDISAHGYALRFWKGIPFAVWQQRHHFIRRFFKRLVLILFLVFPKLDKLSPRLSMLRIRAER